MIGRPARAYRLLLLLPFVWQVAMVPVANAIAWRPFGLPFLMFWEMAGVVFASLMIGLVYGLDRRTERGEARAEDGV